MKKYVVFLLLQFANSKIMSQSKTDTIFYNYVSLFSKKDTGYIKIYYLNNKILVRNEYYGWRIDSNSIEKLTTDTFIVSKESWKKIFNGKVYRFFALTDFKKKKITIENVRRDGRKNISNHYKPVKRIIVDNEEIYIYDLDVMQGKFTIYQDTRIYFSFKYGVVGYINYDSQMFIQKFAGKIKIEFR